MKGCNKVGKQKEKLDNAHENLLEEFDLKNIL